MSKFKAIEVQIGIIERFKKSEFLTEQSDKLLSELKQILEEHKEMFEALKEIESYCDNQNTTHEVFWRISYKLLTKIKTL